MSDPFCASSPEAQALSDDEFWEKVYPAPPEPDYEEIIDMLTEEPLGYVIVESATGEVVRLVRPDTGCPVCGSIEACAYDEEGRPLIHPSLDDLE